MFISYLLILTYALQNNSQCFIIFPGVILLMMIDESRIKLIKRILAGILALVVLVCGIAFSYYLTKGYGEAAVPKATPDNSTYVDSSVELPDESKTPSEFVVVAAFISVEIAVVAVIIYVIIRKKIQK
ncbi:MAG: hypothetical protein E7388_04280 [Ruminococcaceae bacterium]|nr:hypothetical protein [Oscillospiraceae bacterium]